MFRFGVHVSIAKGLIPALDEAEALNCKTMQIFIRNPRGYKRKGFKTQEIKIFNNKLKEKNIQPFVVHASYVLNLASSNKELRAKSISIVKEDLKICQEIDADLYVIHFGSNKDKDVGINLMQNSLERILNNYRGRTQLLLENTAGDGNRLGALIEEIRSIILYQNSVGLCLDSAHLYSSGYNIKEEKTLKFFLNEFDDSIGLKRVKLLHLNDSYYKCGSKKDRHQHIGEGLIGLNGFKLFIRHPKLRNLPMILETPKSKEEDDIKNLNRVKYLSLGEVRR